MSRHRTSRAILGAAIVAGLGCSERVTLRLFADAAESEEGGVPPGPCQTLGAELCNGGDDDCNGAVDEGCAYTLAWEPQTDGEILGHAVGGATFLEPCLVGSVLTGLRVGFGSWLNQVGAVCHQIGVLPDATQTPVGFLVALGARFDTSVIPATTTDPKNKLQDLACPDGLVLTGVDGTTTDDEPRYILGMRLSCAPPLVVTLAGGAVLDFDRARQQTVGPLVCADCATTQAYDYSAVIAPDHLATGVFGGDGLWVDRVGFGASAASVVKW